MSMLESKSAPAPPHRAVRLAAAGQAVVSASTAAGVPLVCVARGGDVAGQYLCTEAAATRGAAVLMPDGRVQMTK